MHKNFVLTVFCFFNSIMVLFAQPSYKRVDTTMKVGKLGYRVVCYNRNPDKNPVTITPIGFDKEVREVSFEVKGRITKAEVDDINSDGSADLVVYMFSNDSIPHGNVIGVLAQGNEAIAPIIFPDIFDDPKLRIGYKGNDVFFLLEGYLVRRFPVYPTAGGPPAAASGNLIRQITYMVVPGERGGFKFKPMRSYEFTKK